VFSTADLASVPLLRPTILVAAIFMLPDQYVTYHFPGSTFTSLNGINKRGLIVGRYLDPTSGMEHRLLVRLTNGASDRSTTGVIPQRQTSQATASQPATFKAVEPAL
jgi:hypothetical protein